MKVLYDEDLANRVSLESCGGSGNITAFGLVLLTGENAGRLSSSEITSFRVPTSCTGREGHTHSSANFELPGDPAESKNLACMEASCTKIGRSQKLPLCQIWNGRIQTAKNSWCIKGGFPSIQAWNTKPEATRRMDQKRRNSVQSVQTISGNSDNNIVPEKRTNKGNMSPQRSLWREGR